MKFKILSYELSAKERKGFRIERPEGKNYYVFLRFRTPVSLYSDGALSDRNKGVCVLYSPRSRQAYFSPDCNMLHDYVIFQVSEPDFFSRIDFPCDAAFYPSHAEIIDETFSAIKNELHFYPVAHQEMINARLTELFVSLSRELNYNNVGDRQYNDADEDFFSLRRDVYERPQNYTVSDMADKLHFSKSYFTAKYKLLFNASPVLDLTRARTDKAKKMLLQGFSAIQTANELNFDSIPNFYKWFKKNTSKTPKKFVEDALIKTPDTPRG